MALRPSLDEIGLRFGTDKASSGHGYLDFYESFLGHRRDEPLKVLEVGVAQGASLRTWEAYFPQATIIGVDIQAAARRFQRGRVLIELADQSNIEELTGLGVAHGPFDLIVEDGSHMWEHQVTSLRTLFPFLRDGGTYIVEDLLTNYGSAVEVYRGIASESCVEFLKRWVDLRVADGMLPIAAVEDPFLRTYGRAAQFITFHRHACVIRKRQPTVSREVSPGLPLAPQRAMPGVITTLHLSDHGDLCGFEGFVNLAGEQYLAQGLELSSPGDVVEYRVRSVDGSWSDWVPGESFLGTRGEAKILTGFALRLRPDARDSYSLRGFGRFQGSSVPVEAADGQDCIGAPGAALCGVQVVLTERGATS
jgi:hypothetical protein